MAVQLLMTFDENNSLIEEEKENNFFVWCKRNGREDILGEWDYERNKGLDPKDFSIGTDVKVWWVKPYVDPKTGKHFVFHWEASVNKRVAGRDCPYLSVPAKKVMPGFNDLATTNPELISAWDEKTNLERLGLRITDVSKGNGTKAFWICEKHGSYQGKIADRVRGQGCPYCAGKQIKVGFNDLATVRPDIAKDWDTERNGVGPESVTIGSIKMVWWRCELGHSWKTSPNDRTSAHVGCPYCSGRRVLPGFNDLATKNPRVAAEWNYAKNGDLLPTQVTLNSNRKVWWICKSGHEFQARVCHRTVYHTGCSVCNKERKTSFSEKAIFFYVQKAYADAQDNVTFPWLGRRELDVYIPSLNCGVEYDGLHWHRHSDKDKEKDEICAENGIRLIRIREEGCPDYVSDSAKIYYGGSSELQSLNEAIQKLLSFLGESSGVSMPIDVDVDRDYTVILESLVTNAKENSLAKTRPDLAQEWDRERNGALTPEYIAEFSNKKVWWKCPKCGLSYKMMVNARTGDKHSNCPYCAGKRIMPGHNDFASQYPELLKEWDYEKNKVDPTKLSPGSHEKIWWKCQNGHSWQINLYVRTGQGTGCPYCAHLLTDGSNSFAALYPNLLEEWDYEQNKIDPNTLLPGSNKKFHWICRKCGYKFVQPLASRTLGGKGCALCASQVLVSGVNDLATQFPEIAKEWNYEKNHLKPNEVSGGTNKKYWWKCATCGYEWEAVVASRTKCHGGCPACHNKVIIPGRNDLATLCPKVMLDWDYEKNTIDPTAVSVGSNQRAFWKCHVCGYEWGTTIVSRTGNGTGCKACGHKRGAEKRKAK